MTANVLDIRHDMTPAQHALWEASLVQPARPTKHVSEMTGAELAAFERTIGIRPDHGEMARRRRQDEARKYGG